MDFAFSEDQELLRAAARGLLTDRVPPERVAEVAESATGWDDRVWPAIVEQGWLELEDLLDEAVLFEEAGRALLPAPFWSSVALARPMVADGRRATLAWIEDTAPYLGDPVLTAAAGGRLTGTKHLVPDLGAAEVCVVVAADGLYAVDPAEASIVPRSTMDRTRRLSGLVLDNTPALPVGGLDLLPGIRLRALAALSCEAVGIAQAALDLAAAYAKERQQFGRVIGSYQAVSHQVADIFSSVQLARSLAYWATWAVASGDESADLACAAATSAAGGAAVLACEAAIQVHGGIGFTYEHILHRYYKRAQWIDAFEGAGARHRAGIAAMLLDGPPPRLADVPDPVTPDGPPLQPIGS